MIKRRRTRQVKIGRVKIGGKSPISVQSMAKVPTGDVKAVLAQIKALDKAGCEIVRLAVKNKEDALSLGKIVKRSSLPIVADIHFDYRLATEAIYQGVQAIRLNPGNIYRLPQVEEVIKKARKARIPIRVGVNSGSLRGSPGLKDEAGAMVKSALDYIKHFERLKFYDIIVSLKAADVYTTIAAYRKIAALCDYPLHLGVTATGAQEDGIIKSSVGIGSLLSEGIGDTIRVSLTTDPAYEVEAARSILQSLGLRSFGPEVISCPTCGRCEADIERVVGDLKRRLKASGSGLKSKRGTIAVMGCEVNGPGEARQADLGIAAGKGCGVLFKKGKIIKKVKAKDFTKEILKNI
jgi:(E)-4-hydroxy-3-methylbut-2-enyl-diphosphate synthase